MEVPYPLISAVHDLHLLYTRHGPAGPYRNTLFHDSHLPEQDWPAAVREWSKPLDIQIRGVACLLANDLAPAAPPLCRQLLAGVINLERLLQGASWRTPAYYMYLDHDLRQPSAAAPAPVYRLFGEVLAVYLDLLVQARPVLREEIGDQVSRIRTSLAQAREAGLAGGAGPVGGAGA